MGGEGGVRVREWEDDGSVWSRGWEVRSVYHAATGQQHSH